MILSGRIWSMAQLHKAGLADSPACILCGDPDGTFQHVAWRCPQLRTARLADPHAQAICDVYQQLPTTLTQYGWVLEISADPTQPLWGFQPGEHQSQLRGVDWGRYPPDLLKTRWPMVARAVEQDDFVNFRYARQWLARRRGDTHTTFDPVKLECISQSHRRGLTHSRMVPCCASNAGSPRLDRLVCGIKIVFTQAIHKRTVSIAPH